MNGLRWARGAARRRRAAGPKNGTMSPRLPGGVTRLRGTTRLTAFLTLRATAAPFSDRVSLPGPARRA